MVAPPALRTTQTAAPLTHARSRSPRAPHGCSTAAARLCMGVAVLGVCLVGCGGVRPPARSQLVLLVVIVVALAGVQGGLGGLVVLVILLALALVVSQEGRALAEAGAAAVSTAAPSAQQQLTSCSYSSSSSSATLVLACGHAREQQQGGTSTQHPNSLRPAP
jgi:O-antigen ligase